MSASIIATVVYNNCIAYRHFTTHSVHNHTHHDHSDAPYFITDTFHRYYCHSNTCVHKCPTFQIHSNLPHSRCQANLLCYLVSCLRYCNCQHFATTYCTEVVCGRSLVTPVWPLKSGRGRSNLQR